MRVKNAKLQQIPFATEHEEQKTFFQWCDLMVRTNRIPELRWAFAVPNGGYRHPATGKRLKEEGVKSGVPDIFIPVPRGSYHGMFAEMKRKGEKLSENQAEWLAYLSTLGYFCVCAQGWNDLKMKVEQYFKVKA